MAGLLGRDGVPGRKETPNRHVDTFVKTVLTIIDRELSLRQFNRIFENHPPGRRLLLTPRCRNGTERRQGLSDCRRHAARPQYGPKLFIMKIFISLDAADVT